METRANDISERLLDFGVRIVCLSVCLDRTATGRHIGKQLMRAGTSSGANYEEACAAESKADFAHKLHIVFKELKETRYWIRLVDRSGLIGQKQEDIELLLNEVTELTNIIAKLLVTVKQR